MKKRFFHYGLLIPLVAFLVHQITQKMLDVSIPLLDAYLDPVCLGVLGLYGMELERRSVYAQPRLTYTDVLLTTLFLVLVSEIVFPHFSDKFVSDWRDAVGICFGTLWFVISSK